MKKLVCVGVLWSVIFHVLVDTSKSTEYSNRSYFFLDKMDFLSQRYVRSPSNYHVSLL